MKIYVHCNNNTKTNIMFYLVQMTYSVVLIHLIFATPFIIAYKYLTRIKGIHIATWHRKSFKCTNSRFCEQ